MSRPIATSGFDSLVLSDIAHVEMGQSPDSRYVVDDPSVGLAFLQGNAEFGAIHPKPKFGCLQPAKTCRVNDVLVSVRAPVGAVNLADRDYCIGRGLAALRGRGIKPSLLGEVVARQSSSLRRVAQGTTFEAISKNDLLGLKLSLPHSQDWPCIAEILDALDTAIQETEAIIAKLKAIKQGLLHDLLTRGIDANGKLRPPQPEAPHLYKESPLGWIPKEWDAVSIYELASNLDGARVPIRQGSRKAGSFPYYGASGVIDWVDSYLFEGDYVLLGEDGENVISRRLPLAFRATGKIWVNNHAHIFEPKIEVDIRFLVEVMEAKDYGPWISGSAQPKITQDALSRIHFIKPPSVEQSAIGDRLQAVASRVQQEEFALDKLWSSRIGLMDDLLTGRVRVTPLLEN